MANESIALISKSYLDRNTVTSSTQLNEVTQVGKYADAKAINDAIKEGKPVKFVDPAETLPESSYVNRGFNDINDVYDYIRECKNNDTSLYVDDNEENLWAFKCNDGSVYALTSNAPEYSSLIDPERFKAEVKKAGKKFNNLIVKKPIPLKTACPGAIYVFPNNYPRYKIIIGSRSTEYIAVTDAAIQIDERDLKSHVYADGKRYDLIQPIRVDYYHETIELYNPNNFPVTFIFSLHENIDYLNSFNTLNAIKVNEKIFDNEDNTCTIRPTSFEFIGTPLNTETSSKDIFIRQNNVCFLEKDNKMAVNRIYGLDDYYLRNENCEIYFRRRTRTIKNAWVSKKNCFHFKIFGDFLIIEKNHDFEKCEGEITVKTVSNQGNTYCTTIIDLASFDNKKMIVVEENGNGESFYNSKISNVFINVTEWYGDDSPKPTCWIGPTKRVTKFIKAKKNQKGGIIGGAYSLNGDINKNGNSRITATIIKLRLKKRGIKSNILHTYYYKPGY